MIPPDYFAREMEKHWTETLGNTCNDGLRETWRLLAETLAGVTAAHDDSGIRERTFTVLPFPTGTGKTQGTTLYFALLNALSRELVPGGLIITRRIKDADLIAAEINTLALEREPGLADADIAISYHSEKKHTVNLKELSAYPVLVITHSAYELALEKLGGAGTLPETWKRLYAYSGGKGTTRELVIIDEALELVEEFQVNIEHLKHLPHFFTEDIRRVFPGEVQTVETVISLLGRMAGKQKEAILSKEPIHRGEHRELFPAYTGGKLPDFAGLRSALRKLELETRLPYGERDVLRRKKLRALVDGTIKGLDALFKSYVYFAKDNSVHSLNTARLIIPNDGTVRGAIILDATAKVNTAYELFKGKARVIDPPQDARNYGNVNLLVAPERQTGKGSLKKAGASLVKAVMGELKAALKGQDRRVLVITHKDIEPHFKKHAAEDLGFREYAVNHFGNIDGSNEWQGYDTAVIYGLPYRPQTWTANLFMAFKGAQSTEWLQNRGKRPFGEHPDIRAAIEIGQLTTDIVQAINRIRCRRVIDTQGNCPSATVFLTLPAGNRGKQILAEIRQEMPGISIGVWERVNKGASKPVRGKKHDRALISFFDTLKGTLSATEIRKHLQIPQRSLERIMTLIKQGDSGNPIVSAMQKNSVTLIPGGRGKPTYFRKAA